MSTAPNYNACLSDEHVSALNKLESTVVRSALQKQACITNIFFFFFFRTNLSFVGLDISGFIIGSPHITNFGTQRTDAA